MLANPVSMPTRTPPPRATYQNKEGKMFLTSLTKISLRGLVSGGALYIGFLIPCVAQVQTTTTATHGEAVKEVKVERGEIVYIKGNTVVLKMEDGTLREFDDVSD